MFSEPLASKSKAFIMVSEVWASKSNQFGVPFDGSLRDHLPRGSRLRLLSVPRFAAQAPAVCKLSGLLERTKIKVLGALWAPDTIF